MSAMRDAALVNATQLPAEALEFVGPGGRREVSVIVKATFTIDAERLAVADEQLPLTGDLARGDPRTTALRYESDFVPWKPRADALCVGSAYPGDAKRAPHCVAAFGVGGW